MIYALTERQGAARPAARATPNSTQPTPYNTYRVAGLPPARSPIPGRAALQAVLHPLDARDDLYFVADGSGGHAFAATLDEHNRNVAKWRQAEPALRARSSRAGSHWDVNQALNFESEQIYRSARCSS